MDSGPIPFADEPPSTPPSNALRPAASLPSVVNTVAADRKCSACGYSLVGIPAVRCPECGAKLLADAPGPALEARDRRRKAATDQIRSDYCRACVLAIFGVGAMVGIVALRAILRDAPGGATEALLAHGRLFAVTITVGLGAHLLLAAIWYGSGEPLPITVLRVVAAMALADAVAIGIMLLPMLFIGPVIRGLAFILMLMRLLDLDPLEALALAICTSTGTFFVVGYVLPALGVG